MYRKPLITKAIWAAFEPRKRGFPMGDVTCFTVGTHSAVLTKAWGDFGSGIGTGAYEVVDGHLSVLNVKDTDVSHKLGASPNRLPADPFWWLGDCPMNGRKLLIPSELSSVEKLARELR